LRPQVPEARKAQSFDSRHLHKFPKVRRFGDDQLIIVR
jgi:hypothetical protein